MKTPAVLGAAGVLVIAIAAATVLLVQVVGGHQAQHGQQLPTKITSTQAVGVANLGPPASGGSGASASATSLIVAALAGLVFTPSAKNQNVQPSEQWQADQMGGGAYILILTPDGLCLTAAGTRGHPTAGLDHCHSRLSQRWDHLYRGTDSAGRGYWQLRSAADGRCLAVGDALADGGASVAMRPCAAGKPWQQLITFLTAF